jgi:hypothetical protein
MEVFVAAVAAQFCCRLVGRKSSESAAIVVLVVAAVCVFELAQGRKICLISVF